jgi:hypothetical protein
MIRRTPRSRAGYKEAPTARPKVPMRPRSLCPGPSRTSSRRPAALGRQGSRLQTYSMSVIVNSHQNIYFLSLTECSRHQHGAGTSRLGAKLVRDTKNTFCSPALRCACRHGYGCRGTKPTPNFTRLDTPGNCDPGGRDATGTRGRRSPVVGDLTRAHHRTMVGGCAGRPSCPHTTAATRLRS